MWFGSLNQTTLKFMNIFFRTVALILVFTATAKLVALTGDVKILSEYDPLFNLKIRPMLLFFGLMELTIAWVLFSNSVAFKNKSILTLWLGACLALYRFGLIAIGFHGYCSCLGQIFFIIGVTDITAGKIMGAIVLFILIGGIVTTMISLRRRMS